VLVGACFLLAVVLPSSASSTSGSGGGGPAWSYGWPVKPFDAPHPIRGMFGEPRTVFYGPPLVGTLLTGDGSFTYHNGLDVAAPDGTPVYAVKSGVATVVAPRTVAVDVGEGTSFQYWHIVPAVEDGDRVIARRTVVGYIRPHYGHVHLMESEHGHPVNPLEPGRLGPYVDTTLPHVGDIVFRAPNGRDELPELIRGAVVVSAEAWDVSTLPVDGIWHGFPIAPALVTWRIERARDHTTVVNDVAAFDVRSRLPTVPFWTSYARGTHQNMPTFKKHRYWLERGHYLFRLTATPLDTQQLADDVYRLIVTAEDSRGNRGTAEAVFTVRNKPGWPPPTPQARQAAAGA
jgi:Peptidase family M23